LNECVACGGTCSFGESCPMKPVWTETQTELVNRLKNITFNTFVQNN
jgi:DNA-binding IscR family transcriptional regulator